MRARRLLREEKRRAPPAQCRLPQGERSVLLLRHLCSCCLETDCRVSRSIPPALSTESLLTCTTGRLSREIRNFLLARDEGIKVSPNRTLWPVCYSLPMGFSWSLYCAQSANRARLNRQPSLRHRGQPLVLSKQVQNAQTGHYLFVDNIGVVSDQFSQVHAALDESKQDFERDRLMLHEISVRSDSGRALGIGLNVDQLRTLLSVERFGRIRKGLRCFLKRRRVAGWELEGLMGHVTPQTGDPVVLPLCLPIRSQVFTIDGGTPPGSVHVPSTRPVWES